MLAAMWLMKKEISSCLLSESICNRCRSGALTALVGGWGGGFPDS